MNMNFRALAAICSVAFTFSSGCSSADDVSSYNSDAMAQFFTDSTQAALVPIKAEPSDFAAPQEETASVSFAQEYIGVRGEGVSVEGNAAVITSGGVYKVSGESKSGRLVIDSEEPVSLILTGLVLSGDGAVVECTDKTAELNISVDTGTSSLSGEVGVLSQGEVVINGSGKLEIMGGSAIQCRGLKLCGAALEIFTADDAVVCSEYVIAAAGNTDISSSGGGISTEGYFSITDGRLSITSATNGIGADKAVFVSGGEMQLTSGGGSSAVCYIGGTSRYPKGRHGGFSTDGSADFDFGNLISGDGSRVQSKKGIRTNGFVDICGGVLTVSSADDAVSAHEELAISGGELRLSSGDDAIHADNGVVISGGTVEVTESYTGIESMNVTVSGGSVSLCSFCDGVAAAGGSSFAAAEPFLDITDRFISISGGTVTITAGGDGIDSAGTAAISGGDITIFSSGDKDFGSLVYGDSFVLSGGRLTALGSAEGTMAPMIVSGSCILMYADIGAGSLVELKDSGMNIIAELTAINDCGSVIISSDDLRKGEEYTLYVDGVSTVSVKAKDGICGDYPYPDEGRNGELFEDFTSGQPQNGMAA